MGKCVPVWVKYDVLESHANCTPVHAICKFVKIVIDMTVSCRLEITVEYLLKHRSSCYLTCLVPIKGEGLINYLIDSDDFMFLRGYDS